MTLAPGPRVPDAGGFRKTRQPMARILVAEDDAKQAQLIRMYLEREGHAVSIAGDGRTALEQIRQKRPDLVVLDVMMPGVDGLDVCRIVRAESDVPIVMVTARSTEDDLLLGLDLGADDYVTKPYSPRELMARIRTVLRRGGSGPGTGLGATTVHQVGDLLVDTGRHEVRLRGRLVELTPTEFKLLALLAATPGRAYSRQELLDAALGFDHYALERTVDVHVMNLRRKVEDDHRAPRYLLTVYGVGYKMAERVDGEAGGVGDPATGQPDGSA
jgi:DNA-binding response OmpR family regulator